MAPKSTASRAKGWARRVALRAKAAPKRRSGKMASVAKKTGAKAARGKPGKARVAHFDVIIAGAGISGVGAAWHLTHQMPGTSFLVLEALETFGGTWAIHTYPGIRSDSDLYTFGYRFKPWVGPPIASADEILAYMGEVINESRLDSHIRYRHRILSAAWSSKEKRWTLTVQLPDGAKENFTCNFLWMCQGYYDFAKGYTPEWKGMKDFAGRIIHPQTWPDDADLKGKRVIVIGSGATAATLVPAIADDCAHVTVLQRSPTYFVPGRNVNDLAEILRQIEVDETVVHDLVRRKILFDQANFTKRSFEEPEAVRKELLDAVRMCGVPEEMIEKHFSPRYRPWRQRIAFVPDGDIFRAVLSGKASIETDEIDCFTKNGIKLKSGKELAADVIITATGFNLSVLGGIPFAVDGKPVNFADTVTYRGMMFTGVPNMLWVFGYFRASWTLRVDILADFVVRLLKHMKKKKARQVEVRLRPEDRHMELLPWMDPENFNPGYLMRAMHLMPKRGSNAVWQHTQDYWKERNELPAINLEGKEFKYG